MNLHRYLLSSVPDFLFMSLQRTNWLYPYLAVRKYEDSTYMTYILLHLRLCVYAFQLPGYMHQLCNGRQFINDAICVCHVLYVRIWHITTKLFPLKCVSSRFPRKWSPVKNKQKMHQREEWMDSSCLAHTAASLDWNQNNAASGWGKLFCATPSLLSI